MKKITILTFLLCLFTFSSLYGQFYAQPFIGHSFASHPQDWRAMANINGKVTAHQNYLHYSSGIHTGLNVGFDIKDYFFVELGTQYTFHSKGSASINKPDLTSIRNSGKSYSYTIYGSYGKREYNNLIFQISPLIGLKLKKKKYQTYFKIGLNIMKFYNQTKAEFTEENIKIVDFKEEVESTNVKTAANLTGGFDKGLKVNFGLGYELSKSLEFIVDFSTVYNSYKITKSEIESYEIDGVDRLNEIDKKAADNIDFVKFNLSHVSVNIGVKKYFSFSSSK